MAWLAQRQRDIIFPAVPARTMRGNSEGPSEATRNFAKDIVDEFVLDIRGTGSKLASLDFSWSQFQVRQFFSASDGLFSYTSLTLDYVQLQLAGGG